jgi:hypothetical protein
MNNNAAIPGLTSRTVSVGRRQIFLSELGSGYPVLMLHGGGEALRQRMPDCDLYLFSKTGHWVQWERAAEFNAVTAGFLACRTPA